MRAWFSLWGHWKIKPFQTLPSRMTEAVEMHSNAERQHVLSQSPLSASHAVDCQVIECTDVPRRGESLFNDASSLTLFAIFREVVISNTNKVRNKCCQPG